MAKVRDDLGKCGPIDSDGQITQLVEGRPRHLQLSPQVSFQIQRGSRKCAVARPNVGRQAPPIAGLGKDKAQCLAVCFLILPVENRTCGFDRIRLSTLVLFLMSPRPSSSFGIFAHAFMPRRACTRPCAGIISWRLRVSLPQAPARPRLRAFAKGRMPRVDGVPVLRLRRPIRLSPLASR
jgi:hypothetical protein